MPARFSYHTSPSLGGGGGGAVIHGLLKKKKDLSDSYHVPDTVLGLRGATVNWGEKVSAFEQHPFWKQDK